MSDETLSAEQRESAMRMQMGFIKSIYGEGIVDRIFRHSDVKMQTTKFLLTMSSTFLVGLVATFRLIDPQHGVALGVLLCAMVLLLASILFGIFTLGKETYNVSQNEHWYIMQMVEGMIGRKNPDNPLSRPLASPSLTLGEYSMLICFGSAMFGLMLFLFLEYVR